MGPKSRWGGGVGSSGDRLCQTSPIPRSPDGDNNVSKQVDELKPVNVVLSKNILGRTRHQS